MLENLSFKNEDTTIVTKPLFDWFVLIMRATFKTIGNIYYKIENIFAKGLIVCYFYL